MARASAGFAATKANSSATALQVVVDQPGMDHLGSLPVAAGPAGRIGVPPAERRRLLGGCRRVAEDVAGVAEGSRQPAVKAQQAWQPFLADRRPPQGTRFQHRPQMPFDRVTHPRAGDLPW